MATPVAVTGKLLNPSDAGQKGAVTATLSQVAYVNGGEVVSLTVSGIVLTDGTWSFDPATDNGLYSNSDLTPANTYYTFAESGGWNRAPAFAVVPAGAGPFVLKDILVEVPPLVSPGSILPTPGADKTALFSNGTTAAFRDITNADVGTLAADLAEIEADIAGFEGSNVLSVAGRDGAVVLAVGDVSGAAPTARQIASGAGLTGGGDLTADRTLSIPTGGVTSAMILDGTIVDADINAAAGIAASKLGTIPWGQISGPPAYALDNAVVHLAGTETITGAKTLSAPLSLAANLSVQPSGLSGVGAAILLKQTLNGSISGDAAFAVVDSSMSDPYKVETYITDNGAYYSGRWMILSQKRYNDGTIQGVGYSGTGTAIESGSLDISGDGNFTALKLEQGLVRGGANAFALATYDADDPDAGVPASSYSWGTGKKKFALGPKGQMLWGTSLARDPVANADAGLSRSANRTLLAEGYGGDFALRLKASANPSLSFSRNGSDNLTLTLGTIADHYGYLSVDGSEVMRAYYLGGVPRVAIGGADNASGILSVIAGSANLVSANLVTLVVRGAVGQYVNLVEAQDSGGAVLASIDPTGKGTFNGGLNVAGGTVTLPAASVAAAALAAIPTSGITGLDTALGLKASVSDSRFTQVAANLQTASYTLVLADAGLAVEMNIAGANTLTVPTNASVAFPVGTILEVFQYGAGQCTLTPGSGVTFRSDGAKAKTAAQYASVSLRKRGTDEWVLSGDLSA